MSIETEREKISLRRMTPQTAHAAPSRATVVCRSPFPSRDPTAAIHRTPPKFSPSTKSEAILREQPKPHHHPLPPPMPPSIPTHASLLRRAAAAAAASLPPRRPNPFPSPARIHRLASAAATRWVRWPPATAPARSVPFGARGLGASAAAGGGGAAMGSDGPERRGRCKERGAEVVANGLCKAAPPPRLLTLPTVLTIGRVAAVPLLISTFYMEGPWAATATTSIFLAAAITDWLDGYIARKMRLGTAFGAFLDPVADKLMVAATLVLLCTKPLETSLLGDGQWLIAVPSIAIIGREITMSAVREWAASQNSKVLEAVAVNKLGKWKTAAQMTALALLLASRDPSLAGQSALVASGVALLYVSAGLAIWSLVVYMRKIWRILLK